MLDKHSWRTTVGIWQHFCLVDYHRLARVSLGHYVTEAEEALTQLGENFFVKQQAATKRPSGNFPRDVIFGWAKSAGSYHNLRAPGRVLDRFFEPGVVVANDGF